MTIAWTIQSHGRVTSTQDLIKTMALQGRPEGVAIHAAEQSGGKGRHGREWVSLPGSLFMSGLLRPGCKAGDVGMLSLMAGVSVAEALRPNLKNPDDLSLKWPNDVLLKGKKAGGLLLESGLADGGRIEWLALGIGLNISAAPLEGSACLRDFSQNSPAPEDLCREILMQISRYYDIWSRGGADQIRDLWLQYGHQAGAGISVKIGPREEAGFFAGIDQNGALLLKDKSGQVKKITAGDIYEQDVA